MLGLGKLTKFMRRENVATVNVQKPCHQEEVYQAVKDIDRPINGRVVAAHLNWDSASVTNRLAELTKKGRLRIAYCKKGLDGKWRQYYVVNDK